MGDVTPPTAQSRTDDIEFPVTMQRADVLWSMLAERLTPEQADQLAHGIYEPMLRGMYALNDRAEAAAAPAARSSRSVERRLAAMVSWTDDPLGEARRIATQYPDGLVAYLLARASEPAAAEPPAVCECGNGCVMPHQHYGERAAQPPPDFDGMDDGTDPEGRAAAEKYVKSVEPIEPPRGVTPALDVPLLGEAMENACDSLSVGSLVPPDADVIARHYNRLAGSVDE